MALNVQSVVPIDPEPPGADQRWWLVSVDDGTIPAPVKVYMNGSDATAMSNQHDEAEWVAEQVRRRVRDVPTSAGQVSALRALSPFELPWPR